LSVEIGLVKSLPHECRQPKTPKSNSLGALVLLLLEEEFTNHSQVYTAKNHKSQGFLMDGI
jgi:hypothetical protein